MTNNGKIKSWLLRARDKAVSYLEDAYGDVRLGEELLGALHIVGRVVYTALAILLDIVITLLLICAITGIIVVTAFAVYVNNNVDPTFDDSLIVTESDSTSQLYYMDYTDRDNRIGTAVEIENQVLVGEEYSLWADYNELPKNLINAIIAIEDQRFRSHNGVDWFRTAAAAANQVLHLKSTFGGSTITQQLVKNATHYDDFTIQRKVQEILSALNLESKHSKEEIITMYLNIISLSQNCTGVQSAAHTYFSKDVSELSLIECAAIAAIPKSPYKYDPLRHPENNTSRRRDVLDKMLELGFITRDEYNEAYYADLELNISRSSGISTVSSWYTDAVIEDVINDYVEQYNVSREIASLKVYKGGWNIYTVMVPEIQAKLEKIYLEDKYFPHDAAGVQPQSAAVIIDPTTGDIVALVGGRGEKKESRGLNRATQSRRPSGSSIKPISVYGPAIEAGLITWSTVQDDVPVNFGTYTDPKDASAWPKNSPNKYDGLTTIYDGLRKSKNAISIRTLMKLGIDASFDFVKNKCHIDSVLERYENAAGEILSDKALAPLGLGQFTLGITVRELTTAYQIFANHGVYNYSRTYINVTDKNGEVVLSTEKPSEVVISDQTASIMTKLMEAVVDSGTAKNIKLKKSIDIAGKTGTTNADYDRWFVGYTPYYLCGVWFGFDLNQTLTNYKDNPAMMVWDTVMTEVHSEIIAKAKAGEEELKTFTDAPGLVKVTYCKDSGKLMTDTCAKDPRGSRAQTGYFTMSTVPTESCDVHVLVNYDKTTKGVASQYCDHDDIVQYALIKVEGRSFPKEVKVTDAQYVYRELPSTVSPAGFYGDPFFVNTLANGEYCGTSKVTTPFNHFCYQHYDYSHSTGIDTSHFAGETTAPPETTPPVTDPPATDPPVTVPPATTPPDTEPKTDPPVTDSQETSRGEETEEKSPPEAGPPNETTASPSMRMSRRYSARE